MNLNYKATDLAAVVSAAEYMAGYSDAGSCLRACMACPRYGRVWSCPPLLFNPRRLSEVYRRVELYAVRIIPECNRLPAAVAGELLLPERLRLEHKLLEREHVTAGLAVGLSGRCTYCGDEVCARVQAKPCRHPELVRPSLEAMGFDVAATADRLLGSPLEWGTDGCLPPSLMLVGAVFCP